MELDESQTLPWNKRDDETAKAYECFCCYLKLPPSHLSLLNAFRKYRGFDSFRWPDTPDPENPEHAEIPTKTPNHVVEWAQRYEWQTRRDAYVEAREAAYLQAQREQHEDELNRFREELKQLNQVALQNALQVYALTGFKLGRAVELISQIQNGEADEADLGVELSDVPGLLRAAAQTSQTATDALADALGVHEVLTEIDKATE